jgi:hypothetical protein
VSATLRAARSTRWTRERGGWIFVTAKRGASMVQWGSEGGIVNQ